MEKTPGEWTCQSCGATFPSIRFDTDVERCSSCVRAEIAEETIVAIGRRLRELGNENARLYTGTLVGELRAENAKLRKENETLCVHGLEPTDEEWVALRGLVEKLRGENARLRARLLYECPGCPGCGTGECPDALDVAQSRIDEMEAERDSAIGNLRQTCDEHAEVTLEIEAENARLREQRDTAVQHLRRLRVAYDLDGEDDDVSRAAVAFLAGLEPEEPSA